MAELALNYEEKDGLYYPIIKMPEQTAGKRIGKYGRMAMNYLRENQPERYRTLLRFGKLDGKMMEVDEEANSLLDEIMENYLEKHKPTDPSSTMEMWKLREQAKMQAEEIVLNRVVMKFR